MTPEQVVAIIVAITGLTAAIGVVLVQLAQIRKDMNGRLTQLVDHATTAARKDGELAGRDYAARSGSDRAQAEAAGARDDA